MTDRAGVDDVRERLAAVRHAATRYPSHCDQCMLRWPCDYEDVWQEAIQQADEAQMWKQTAERIEAAYIARLARADEWRKVADGLAEALEFRSTRSSRLKRVTEEMEVKRAALARYRSQATPEDGS